MSTSVDPPAHSAMDDDDDKTSPDISKEEEEEEEEDLTIPEMEDEQQEGEVFCGWMWEERELSNQLDWMFFFPLSGNKLVYSCSCHSTQLWKKSIVKKTSTQILKRNLNSNWQIQQLKLWQNKKKINSYLKKNPDQSLLLRTTWHLDKQWDVLEAAICNLSMFFPQKNKKTI